MFLVNIYRLRAAAAADRWYPRGMQRSVHQAGWPHAKFNVKLFGLGYKLNPLSIRDRERPGTAVFLLEFKLPVRSCMWSMFARYGWEEASCQKIARSALFCLDVSIVECDNSGPFVTVDK